MKVDIIIVSNGFNNYLRDMTRTTIKSCQKSEKNNKFNITVIEKQSIKYADVFTIHYNFPFNYNRCLNLGIEKTSNEWLCLCNNDLIFTDGWLTECLKYNYLSMSPNWKEYKGIKNVRTGYKIRKQVAGWCILCNRSIFEKIGKLHEGVKFWWSDHIYADQLKKAKIKHALILNSLVKHLETQTLKLMPGEVIEKFQYEQEDLYKKIKL